MQDDQTNYYNMVNGLAQFLDDESAIYLGNMIAENRKMNVENRMDLIDGVKDVQDQPSQPTTAQKNQLKGELAAYGIVIAEGLFNYYADPMSGNDPIKAGELDLEETDLKPSKDMEAFDINSDVFDVADPAAMRANLLLQGITGMYIDGYQIKLTAYGALIGQPGNIRSQKKAATAQLKVHFKDLRGEIELLRKAMGVYRVTQPDFYETFINNSSFAQEK